MSKFKHSLAAVAFVLTAGAATAQELNPGISCLEGDVPAQDWAELTSNYKESLWDSKAGMRVRTDGGALELTVTDETGNNVCDRTADDRARCRFSFSPSYSGMFNIRIDNLANYSTTRYRLCAE